MNKETYFIFLSMIQLFLFYCRNYNSFTIWQIYTDKGSITGIFFNYLLRYQQKIKSYRYLKFVQRSREIHYYHHPSKYTFHCWAPAFSQKDRAWVVRHTPTLEYCDGKWRGNEYFLLSVFLLGPKARQNLQSEQNSVRLVRAISRERDEQSEGHSLTVRFTSWSYIYLPYR